MNNSPAARAVPYDRLPVQALQHRTAERERGLHDGFRDGRLLREVDGIHENHPDGPGAQQRGTGRGEGGLPDGRLTPPQYTLLIHISKNLSSNE